MSVIKPILQQPEQITYFSGANNYCWTFFRDGRKKLLAKPISYLELQLPTFIRVHKTALVNPIYVKRLYQPPRKKMTGKIYLESGEVLPVSRRRWDFVAQSLQNYTLAHERISREKPIDDSTRRPSLSVYVVTTHETSHTITQQILQRNWPNHQLYKNTKSAFLPQMLDVLPANELPTLLMLDARTSTPERLGTLQELKSNKKLRSIPVILFVSPTDQAVIDGYQYQANSVVSFPSGYTLSDEILKRICQFWLGMAKLPVPGATGM